MTKLPGLPTMSALMLSAVLATWLSVAGPPNLKDWQTLIASCIALIGGGLAYKGAMAKVKFDRDIHEKSFERQELGVYLRLRSTLVYVRQFADVAVRKVREFRRAPTTELSSVRYLGIHCASDARFGGCIVRSVVPIN